MACKIIYKGKALPEEEAKIEINNDVVDDLNEQAVGKSIINSALLTDEEINQQITDLNKFKTVIENNYFKLEDNISVSSLVINKHIKNAPASLGKVKIDSKWRTKEEAKKQVEENLKQRKLFSKLKRNFGITEEQLNLIENVSADKAISSAEDLINAIESKLLSLNSLVLNSKKSKSATLQQKEQAINLYSQYLEQNPNGSVEEFKSWVNGRNNFDKELAQRIQDKLQKLYPEIKLNITNNPVWEISDDVFDQSISGKLKTIGKVGILMYALYNLNAIIINKNIQYENDTTSISILKDISKQGFVYLNKKGELINSDLNQNEDSYKYLYELWSKAGFPKIEISKDKSVSHYNPLTNTIVLSLYTRQGTGYEVTLENDEKGNITGYGISVELLLAEMAHAIQAANGELTVGRGILDFIKSKGNYQNTYSIEGSVEHDAHSKIDDELINTYYKVIKNQKEKDQIIGQANIKAMSVLVDAINQKQDTLPHEYAHHYIAWFRDSTIVQEAIKKWGSEEALVQSIGEQVVKQKGEVYNWWKNFVKWIMNQFNSLSKLQKEELTQILTDAFLTRQDLNNIKNGSFQQFQQSLNKPNTNPILQGNQQEQQKKFQELQERLNNREFLEGAKLAFESSEELQNVAYEAAGLRTLENNKLEQDIKELIKGREDMPSSIFLSYLLNNNLIPKIQEYIKTISSRHGEWNELYKRLRLDYSPINTKSERAKLMSHELMHTLSHKYITSYEALRQPDYKEYILKVNENEKIKGTNRTVGLVNLTKEQIDAFDNLVRIKEKVFDFIKKGKYKLNENLLKRDFG